MFYSAQHVRQHNPHLLLHVACVFADCCSTFGADAGSCNALLAGAKATFTEVSVYAMVTKTIKPVTPATLTAFADYASQLSQPPPPCIPGTPGCPPPCTPGTSNCPRACDPLLDPGCSPNLNLNEPKANTKKPPAAAKVGVASVDGAVPDAASKPSSPQRLELVADLNQVKKMRDMTMGELHTVGEWLKDSYQKARGLAKDDLMAFKDMVMDEGSKVGSKMEGMLMDKYRIKREFVFTCCGVTFVARGDVVITQGSNKYVGTIESPLSWDDYLLRLPRFLLTPAPFNGRTAPPKPSSLPISLLGIDLTRATAQALDVGDLAKMCYGPDAADIPRSNPGNIGSA